MSKEKIPMEKPKKIKPASKKAVDNLLKNGIGNKAPKWEDSVPGENTEEPAEKEKKGDAIKKTEIDVETLEKELENKAQDNKKIGLKSKEEEIKFDKKIRKSKKSIKTLETEEATKEVETVETKTIPELTTPKIEKSRIEKLKGLGFEELTAKIEIYVANALIKIKNEGFNKNESQEELEKILEMEKVADNFLGATIQSEYYNRKYSKEETDKFYSDLKIAKDKLLKLRGKISPEEEMNVEIMKNGEVKEIVETFNESTEIPAKNKEFEELTEKINTHIKEIKNKNINKEQVREELEKIKEIGNKAGHFLANAEKFAITRKLSDDEIIKMCNDLKSARNELRKLYIEIANQNVESRSAKNTIEDWPEEVEKDNGVILNTSTKENEQEISEGASEGFTIGEKIVSKDKLAEINEKIRQKELDIEIAEQKMAIYRPAGGLFRKKPVVRDLGYYSIVSDIEKLNKELEELKKIKAEIELGPKKEELEKLEMVHRIYGPAGWHKKPAVKDSGYYDREEKIAELRSDIKKLGKEKGRDEKEQDNTELEKELKEVVILPEEKKTKEKKQGFFARLFGRKGKTPKETKILTEEQLLKSVGKISKKRLREIIDEQNKKGLS